MDTGRPAFPVGINVIVVRDSKLLLGKRKNTFGDGSWGLPGGHLEYGEDMKMAAARELKEETGLTATQYTFSNLVNNQRSDTHYLQVGFTANGVAGEPQLLEPDRCYEWKWFGLDDLPEPIFVGHVQQIELYKAQRKFIDA